MLRMLPFREVKAKSFVALISEPMFLMSLRVVMLRLLFELMVARLLVRLLDLMSMSATELMDEREFLR